MSYKVVKTFLFPITLVMTFSTVYAGLSYNTAQGSSDYNIVAQTTGNGGFTLTGTSLNSTAIYTVEAAFDGSGSTWNTVNFSLGFPLLTGQVVTDGSGNFTRTITHSQISTTNNYPGSGNGTVRFRLVTGGVSTTCGTGGADITIE